MEAEREARDMRTRILWAGCILNGAGLLALVQLVSQVDDPDYALSTLRWSFALLACGLAVGGFSLAFNYIALMNRLLWATAKHGASNSKNTPTETEWWEAQGRAHYMRDAIQGRAALYFCMLGFTLGVAGILLGVFGSLNGHRLQPRDQTQTPERFMQGISLLHELMSSDAAPEVNLEVRAPAAASPAPAPSPTLQNVPDKPAHRRADQ